MNRVDRALKPKSQTGDCIHCNGVGFIRKRRSGNSFGGAFVTTFEPCPACQAKRIVGSSSYLAKSIG